MLSEEERCECEPRRWLGTAEHGSFTAAARSLYIAQPSLSEQVRQLEG